ncbi:hypothetical protein HC891_23600 [Candidatus Gracilibacteria bacterium]|nr:hypothetical protein [Candidatus Gracilibacteria bacterium]
MIVDEAAQAEDGAFDLDTRLIEREAMCAEVRSFLGELVTQRRGVLTINGPSGSGHSRFLSEVGTIFSRQGFEVLALRTSRALGERQYGAFTQLDAPWQHSVTLEDPPALLNAALEHVATAGHTGLLITIDTLADLDTASYELLHELMVSASPLPIAVAYTQHPEQSQRLFIAEVPLQTSVELSAFSVHGMHIWLRSILRWEPPERLIMWLYEQTDGLPALLRRGLSALIDRHVLIRNVKAQWAIVADLQATPLREWIAQMQQAQPYALPAYQHPFIGRAEEIQRFKRLVGKHNLVTITGWGGVGKTRLAAQATHELMADFGHGVYLVPLGHMRQSELMADAIVRSLGIATSGRKPPQEVLLTFLRRRRLLLILDAVELNSEAGALISAVLREAPEVKLVVTARERLQLPQEAVLELRGLVSPHDEGERLAGSAARLFVQQIHQPASSAQLTEHDRRAIVRICRLVEGLPLRPGASSRVVDNALDRPGRRCVGAPQRCHRATPTGAARHQRRARLLLEHALAERAPGGARALDLSAQLHQRCGAQDNRHLALSALSASR